MFDQTFVDGVGKTNKSWTVFLSFFFQIALIGVMILIPLIYTDVLPKAQLVSFLQAPAPATASPPHGPLSSGAPVVKVVKIAPRQFDAGRLTAPKVIPKDIAIIKEEDLPPAMAGAVVSGIPGGIPGGTPGGVLTGWCRCWRSAASSSASGEGSEASDAEPDSSWWKRDFAANLIKKVTPPYPPLAKQARIPGTVKFNAVISKDGTIQNLTLVSGHLLVPAAT